MRLSSHRLLEADRDVLTHGKARFELFYFYFSFSSVYTEAAAKSERLKIIITGIVMVKDR